MTTAQMNDPERDGTAAVGIPVDRTVRPWGQCIDLDAQPTGFDRRMGDIIRWEQPAFGPLYDQAALDAALAAQRELCAAAVRAVPTHRWVDGSDQYGRPCPAKVVATKDDYVAAILGA
ncbi:MAG: hypothetical protein WCT47_19295 [Betaproteobacteria bacterium]|jgi:hypothetical protein